jgi:hypothetical protein
VAEHVPIPVQLREWIEDLYPAYLEPLEEPTPAELALLDKLK